MGAPRSAAFESAAEAQAFVVEHPAPPSFRFIGRCKACRRAFVEEIVTRWTTDRDRYGTWWVRRVSAGSEITRWCDCSVEERTTVEHGRVVRSTSRATRVTLRLVKGTYSPDHVCGARCLNAVGPSCECSCAGENHGAGHVPATA